MSHLETLVGLLERSGLTVATAESCTGGCVGAALTSMSGSSLYYLGGVISYSNAAKSAVLGVEERVISQKGAVSAECAQAMAFGCRQLLKADIAVGITGIAGPTGGTKEKPVGTVFISVSGKWGDDTRLHEFSGDRSAVRAASVEAALQQMIEYLQIHQSENS